MKRFISLFLALCAFATYAQAQVSAIGNIRTNEFFDCPVPVGTDGYINIYKMITALSSCAGLDPELLLENPLRTELIDFGTYTPIYSETETGTKGPITGVQHATWDQEIKLELGLIFGFRHHFQNAPETSNQQIEIHIIRPDPNAEDGSGFKDEISYKPLSNGMVEMTLFQISSPEDMQPGIWTFEIHHQGRVVAVKHFNMVL